MTNGGVCAACLFDLGDNRIGGGFRIPRVDDVPDFLKAGRRTEVLAGQADRLIFAARQHPVDADLRSIRLSKAVLTMHRMPDMRM